MTKITKVNNFCKMCPTGCGITVDVENGRAIKVGPNKEHPYNRLCPKSAGLLDVTYSKERITSPMKKTNGKWKKISWDEAFDFIAGKLKKIKEEDGGNGLFFHLGNPLIGSTSEKMVRRFADVYGSPNYTSGASFCYYSRKIAMSLTFDYGRINALPSFRGTKCMVVWGTNPGGSSFLQNGVIKLLAGRGAKLAVIDPVRIPLAKDADIFAQIRPGTDVVLAMSMINVIIEEDLYDKEFVQNWTVGFDELVERAGAYPPEKAEEITWVPADTIRDLARLYATNTPSTITSGVSVDHSSNGVQANRAIAILISITGNIDKHGGNIWPSALPIRDLRMPDMAPPANEGVGSEYPLYNRFAIERNIMESFDALLKDPPSYPVKAMFVEASNPVMTFPDTHWTKKALEKLDLLVVTDLFMTETAKLADVFLPASYALETNELRDYSDTGISMAAYAHKAIEPVGESKPNWEIWAELGRRMGYEMFFPWENSDALFEYMLETTDMELGQVKAVEGGIMTRPEEQRYLKVGFNTPSGKIDIYSQLLERYGYDPLPSYKEAPESPVSDPELAEKYPLFLVAGAKVMAMTHSQHRNIPSMLKRNPEPLVQINTETAKGLGIGDGDMVSIESPRGEVRMKAKVTDDIHSKVVSAPHGWADANINLLTAGGAPEVRDPISGFSPYKTGLCRVSKV